MTIERKRPAFAKAPASKHDDPIAEHWSSASPDQIESSRTRVLHRLQSTPELLEPDLHTERDLLSSGWRWPRVAWASAAIAVFAVAVFTARVVPPSHDDGTPQRSGPQSREATLADGSRIETRPESEFSVEQADDGIAINLRSGSIIVNAAKQHGGHLYVRTEDMTVSVVGTVFVVNATKDGSRVGVIEGEVRVREHMHDQKIETSLRAGQAGVDQSDAGGAAAH
jgi:ferric-dicitrate binding protein FerR (iron transport regulator)